MSFVSSLSNKVIRRVSRVSRSSLCIRRRAECTHFRTYATEANPLAASHDLKPTIYGQPLHPSHSHLGKFDTDLYCADSEVFCSVGLGELTPGISAQEYDRRRKDLMDGLPENTIVVCIAGQMKYMSGRESSCYVLSIHLISFQRYCE